MPSGRYELSAALDLRPFFGVVSSGELEVEVKVPGPELLDEYLKRLESEDKDVRAKAVFELQFFKEEGERVCVALAAMLKDPHVLVRRMAILSLSEFPDQAEKYLPAFLEVLEKGGNSERYLACKHLPDFAPGDLKVLEAMERAAAASPKGMKHLFQKAVDAYRAGIASKK